MIVITDSGAKILSDFVPRSIAGIEKVMAEPGLLQRYGRIRQLLLRDDRRSLDLHLGLIFHETRDLDH